MLPLANYSITLSLTSSPATGQLTLCHGVYCCACRGGSFVVQMNFSSLLHRSPSRSTSKTFIYTPLQLIAIQVTVSQSPPHSLCQFHLSIHQGSSRTERSLPDEDEKGGGSYGELTSYSLLQSAVLLQQSMNIWCQFSVPLNSLARSVSACTIIEDQTDTSFSFRCYLPRFFFRDSIIFFFFYIVTSCSSHYPVNLIRTKDSVSAAT